MIFLKFDIGRLNVWINAQYDLFHYRQSAKCSHWFGWQKSLRDIVRIEWRPTVGMHQEDWKDDQLRWSGQLSASLQAQTNRSSTFVIRRNEMAAIKLLASFVSIKYQFIYMICNCNIWTTLFWYCRFLNKFQLIFNNSWLHWNFQLSICWAVD